MGTFRSFGFAFLASLVILVSLPAIEAADHRRALRVVDEWSGDVVRLDVVESGDEAVCHGFRGHPGVIGDTEHGALGAGLAHESARASQVSSTVSGLSEMLSIPSAASQVAKSG